MTDEEYEEARARAGAIPLSMCPTCKSIPEKIPESGGLTERPRSQYKLHGELHDCDCETQIKLRRAYLAANIGDQYQELNWDDYNQDEEVRVAVASFLAGWEAYRDNGVSLSFTSRTLGTGKAQPLDAKILTPFGWTEMGRLAEGDVVVGSDGTPTRVIGVYPQGKREVFRITFADGSNTECCAEHLWTVSDLQTTKTAPLSEIMNSKRSWRIPLVGPISMPHINTPIDPYVLGLLIGDGCLLYRVVLSTGDEEIVDAVQERLPAGHRIRKIPSSKYEYSIVSDAKANEVLNAIRRLGLNVGSKDKFIPNSYLWNATDQRIELLRGLMDSDGSAWNNEFSTSSTRLMKGFQSLVRSLGGVCRAVARGPESDSWRVYPQFPEGLNPFRLSRKVSAYRPAAFGPRQFVREIESVGVKETQCIRVDSPDHLYVTDDFILTHNTFAATYVGKELIKRGQRVFFIMFPDMVNTFEKADGEKLEARMKTVHFLILDDVLKPFSERQRDFYAFKLESIIRHRTNFNLPTIITTNLSSGELEEWYPRTFSLLSLKNIEVRMRGNDARQAIHWDLLELARRGEKRPVT